MQKTTLSTLLSLLIATSSSTVLGSFMYNDLQSAASMGNAFAGAGVAGDDASIMFYNPAGIALLDEKQIVVSGVYVDPQSTFTVNSATDTFGEPKVGAPGQEYSAIPQAFGGSVFATTPIDDTFMLGMSFTSPYDGLTDYSNSVVENTARQAQIYTYTGNLTLAMEVNEQLSIGIGGNAQYLKTKMNASLGNTPAPSGNDLTFTGFTEYEGDDIAFYPNFGIIYEFSEETRLGLNYRMHVNQDTEGNFLTEIGIIGPNEDITTAIELPATSEFFFPDIVSLNFFHQLDPKVELLADVMFTRWNGAQNISVILTEPLSTVTEPVNVALNLRNTWRFGLGANYYLQRNIKLRTGVAYDQSPVTDENRLLQTPDSNRVDIAVGLMYKPQSFEKIHFDIAYMHTLFEDGTVSQLNPIINAFPGFLPPGSNVTSATGSFHTYANFIAAQMVYGY